MKIPIKEVIEIYWEWVFLGTYQRKRTQGITPSPYLVVSNMDKI